MRPFLSAVFGAGFTVAVSWALGRLLFQRLKINLHRGEHDLLAGVTGAVLLSLAVFLLCVANLARTPVFLTVGFAALAAQWKYGSGTPGSRFVRLSTGWKLAFALPFLFYAALYLSNSLAPEISPDGTAYHLGLVARYFREHGFHRLTTNIYANLSQGAEMLYLFAFSFGRHSAAATVHCSYLLTLPFLILNYGRYIGRSQAGVCAAMIAYLSPVAGIDGVSAYNDVALAATAVALFYLLEIWREENNDRLLIPIGLLTGFCFAIKYTGFVAVLYVATVVFWQRRPKALVPITSAAALIALPWIIKNWMWLGNPVSPFLNRVFPNPYVHVTFEKNYSRWLRSYDLPSFRPIFWIDTVSGQLGGQLGPIFLLSPLALLSLRSKPGRHCLLAALFFLLPYPQNIGARFLLPAMPFVALGMALAFDFSRSILILLIATATVCAWPRVIKRYRAPGGSWHIQKMQWQAALRLVPSERFLDRHLGHYIVARRLDYLVPDHKRIWSSTPVAEAYTNRDILVSYQSAEGELLQDILLMPLHDDMQPTWNLRFTFPATRMRRIRFVQTATSPTDFWSIGEIGVFRRDVGLSRSRAWRLDAKPNPWDVCLAYDGNPVTRWRAWQSIHPGMYVDLDFGEEIEIDHAELHCSHDQWKIDVHAESCGVDGCKPLEGRLEKLGDAPYSDLRKLATRTVKARGIDYLLIEHEYDAAADMAKDPERWGLKLLGNWNNTKLYEIE